MHKNSTHGKFGTAIYRTWGGMIQRCTNPKCPVYKYYGGKGIKVCERWLKFENFYADMGERPDDRSLDRFPNKGGDYEPGNCRWATKLEQAQNRSSVRMITWDGKTLNLSDWAKARGIPKQTLHNRVVVFGWPLDRALGYTS